MSRYVEGLHVSTTGFIQRQYGLRPFIAPALFALSIVLILLLSQSYSQSIPLSLLSASWCTFYIVNDHMKRRVISLVEFQLMFMSNVLRHNTAFYAVSDHKGRIIYRDSRFNAMVPESIKVLEDTLLHLQIGRGPQLAYLDNKLYKVSVLPLARPEGYHVLQAQEPATDELSASLLQKHGVGTYIAEESGRILNINQALALMLGLENSESARGLNLKDLVVEENFQGEKVALKLRSGILGLELFNTSAQFGPFIYGLITSSRFVIPTNYWESHLDEMGIGFAEADLGGKILNANKSFLGLSKAKTLFDLVPANYHDKILNYLSSSQTHLCLEFASEDDKSTRIYSCKFENLIIAYAIEVAQRVKGVHSQKLQIIGQLAGGVAHDFNNILTSVIGFCDLLLGRISGNENVSDVMQIKQNAARAAGLVKQLLELSRKQLIKPTVINPVEAIENIYYLVRQLLGENVRLEIEHAPGLGSIKIDPGQFEQIVINLVVNAKAAMEGSNGSLKIGTENITIKSANSLPQGAFIPMEELIESGEYVEIKIIDSGHGISSEIMERIFEPFFSTKESGFSSGLGLATVHGIIRQNDGYIYVQSSSKGSTFVLLFPRFYEFSEKKAANIEAVKSILEPLSILLVEDESSIRNFMARILQQNNHKVLVAESAEEALEIYDHNKIDLIISDVVMNGMSGPELVEVIKKRQDKPKVLFISGYMEQNLNDERMKGCYFLPKPFTIETLLSKLQEIVSKC